MTPLLWLWLLVFAGSAFVLLAWAGLVMGQIDDDLREFAGFSGLCFDIGLPQMPEWPRQPLRVSQHPA